MDHSGQTLVILGHGSSKHPASSESVRNHAQLISEQSEFAFVKVAFLKEEPFLEDCMGQVGATSVVVVPDFLAEGYFTRQVIPSKLSLSGHDKKMIYCPPVGTHPLMAELLQDAAQQLLADWCAADTALVVVGHGSGKNPCSKQTLLHHLERIRRRESWAQVQDMWLEEEPQVRGWRQMTKHKQVVVVPYLLNDGQHGGWDIPEALGVAHGEMVHGVTHQLEGCLVRVSPAVGTSPRFAEAITELAAIWSKYP